MYSCQRLGLHDRQERLVSTVVIKDELRSMIVMMKIAMIRRKRLKRGKGPDNRPPLRGTQEMKATAKKQKPSPPYNRQQVKREPLQHPSPHNKLLRKSQNKSLLKSRNKQLLKSQNKPLLKNLKILFSHLLRKRLKYGNRVHPLNSERVFNLWFNKLKAHNIKDLQPPRLPRKNLQ